MNAGYEDDLEEFERNQLAQDEAMDMEREGDEDGEGEDDRQDAERSRP